MSEPASLEQRFPWIPWRTPIRVRLTSGLSRWGCRLCIGLHGLRGADVKDLWRRAVDVRAHLAQAHPPPGEGGPGG